MGTQYNGFILLKDKKSTDKPRNGTHAAQPKKSTKKETLVQESLAHNKSEAKKIYASKVVVHQQKTNKPTQSKSQKVSSVTPVAHVRSNSRTLEPHEIVLLKHPPATVAPSVANSEETYSDEDFDSDTDVESESDCSESKSSLREDLKPKSFQTTSTSFEIFSSDPVESYVADFKLPPSPDSRTAIIQTYLKESRSVHSQTDPIQMETISISVPGNLSHDSVNLTCNKHLYVNDFKIEKLHIFLSRAEFLVMPILLAKKKKPIKHNDSRQTLSETSTTMDKTFFSKGQLSMSHISLIYTNPKLPLVLTLHVENDIHKVTQESLICLWNIFYSPEPIKILSCWNEIICLCMHWRFSKIIVGGSHDGTVIVWDTDERMQWNRAFPLNFHNAPSAVTSISTNANDMSDFGTIINMCPYENQKSNEVSSLKVFALYEKGYLVEWMVLILNNVNNESLVQSKTDNSSLWSKIRIIQLNLQQLISTIPSELGVSLVEKQKRIFEDGMNDFSDKLMFERSNEATTTVVNLLLEDDVIIILTNKNFLLLSPYYKDLKFKKCILPNDTFAVTACSYCKNTVVLKLSNGTIKTIDFTCYTKPEPARLKHLGAGEILVELSNDFLGESSMFYRQRKEEIFLASKSCLEIIKTRETERLDFNKPIRKIQYLISPTKDEHLVILFKNGDIQIYNLH